jgi:DNA-binding transcriptional LysR family regulator
VQIEDFRYVVQVAKIGSISRAAEVIGITQPALAKAVRRIEADTGMQLFERTAKGVLLTEAGKAFIHRATKIFLEYTDAMQEMGQMRTGELGLLRLGFSRTVNELMVLNVCKRLMHERPAARLELRERLTGELLPMLRAGDFDLVIAPLPHGQVSDMEFIPLYSDQLHIIAMANHPLRKRDNLTLHDLADFEWMAPPLDTKVRQHINDMFRKQGIDGPRIRIETDFGSVATYRLMQGTKLLSICGDTTKEQIKPLGLTPIDVADADFKREIGIMYRPDAYLSPLVQRVITLLASSPFYAVTAKPPE